METNSGFNKKDSSDLLSSHEILTNPPYPINTLFLKYDYIGAPWPNFDWCKTNRVGNGGFVLKSKKFYKLEQKITQINGHNDVVVTNTYYNHFINNECKYAPLDVACKFSLEIPIPECEYNLD